MAYQTTIGWSLPTSGIVSNILWLITGNSVWWGVGLLVLGTIVLYSRRDDVSEAFSALTESRFLIEPAIINDGHLRYVILRLFIGRAELFTEDFFDPVAKAADQSGSWTVFALRRLWVVTFVDNRVGGILFALVFAVDGVLPTGAAVALSTVAEDLARRGAMLGFASAIVGGA